MMISVDILKGPLQFHHKIPLPLVNCFFVSNSLLWLRQLEHSCGHLHVIQKLFNRQTYYDDIRRYFEGMTPTLPSGTLVSSSSLHAAALYQGNHKKKHNIWNIL